MKELIAKRLAEDRAEQLDRVEIAKSGVKSKAASHGALNGSRRYLSINEVTKSGLGDYLDQSAKFIRQVAGVRSLEYAIELRDAGNKFKEEALTRFDREMTMTRAFPGHSERVAFRKQLVQAMDKIVARKVEDFQLGIIEGEKISPGGDVTVNSINIVNSTITDAVLTITQSGKDSLLKDVAQKISDLVKSDEITELPENNRLEVLDHSENIISELNTPAADNGKVLRALKRLGFYLGSAGAEVGSKVLAELAVAWAQAHGL